MTFHGLLLQSNETTQGFVSAPFICGTHTLASCSADSFPSCTVSDAEVRAGRAVEGVPLVTALDDALRNIAYSHTQPYYKKYMGTTTCNIIMYI